MGTSEELKRAPVQQAEAAIEPVEKGNSDGRGSADRKRQD